MKTYAITGASHGIGKAILIDFLNNGHRVINIDKEPLEGIETGDYTYIKADLSKDETLLALCEQLKEEQLDGVVLNAGIMGSETLETLTLDNVKAIMNVNLYSGLFIAKTFAQNFKGKEGRIVFISSTRACMSEADTIAYSMSKGGIESLVHSLAVTLKDKSITVNGIRPGWIHTQDAEQLRDIDHDFHLSKRVGTPHDIVLAVRYITDEGNSFLNGEILTLDGGVTKTMIYPK